MTPRPTENHSHHQASSTEISFKKHLNKHNNTPPEKRNYELVWSNILIFSFFHICGIYGLKAIFDDAKIATTIYAFELYMLSAFGITGGAHRLWSHRSYKANTPLKMLLMICYTISYENSVIRWARDHRVHHKFQETEADPHNAKRGFFYSHIGWMLVKKHPEVEIKGKSIDISDLYSDPVVKFQHKWINILGPLFGIIIPTAIPIFFWGETFTNAYCLNILRILAGLHVTWFVNSAAHLYGQKPFNVNIGARENPFVSFVGIGEGWHNYHHTFPWDYRASEHARLNLTLYLLNLFAKIGWAYDLKIASNDLIRMRSSRTGENSKAVWGWGDLDMQPVDCKEASLMRKART